VSYSQVGSCIGVLSLQGDAREHLAILGELGLEARAVRSPKDLAGLSALVLPGGESTTLSMLLERSGLWEPIARLLGDGMPALGTCAGMILLGKGAKDGRPDQRYFGAIDIVTRRNAFGRQKDSFETDLEVKGCGKGQLRAVFIRAPSVEEVGSSVEVMARLEDQTIVACKQGSVFVTAFHPEIAGDPRVHACWLRDAGIMTAQVR
jgi:5'-phosphate synthase pdxT subunit